jgi:hypothetical protein
MPIGPNANHQPTDETHEEHIRNTQAPATRDVMRRNSLPHTDVPPYLLETPMQEQQRHLDSFHRNQPQANHAHDKDTFSRPGLGDHLDLISRNLADDHYFKMRWRAPDTGDITTGDGTPDTVVENP